jgi:hypothetical protein
VVERAVLPHEDHDVLDVGKAAGGAGFGEGLGHAGRQGAEGAGGGDPAEEAAAGELVRVGHQGSLQGTSAGLRQRR